MRVEELFFFADDFFLDFFTTSCFGMCVKWALLPPEPEFNELGLKLNSSDCWMLSFTEVYCSCFSVGLKFPKRALFFLTLFERVAAVVGVLPLKALLSDFLALVDLFILAGVLIGD